MHVMEPSQNSADWYHFRTVHQWLAGVPRFIPLKLDHQIKCHYGSGTGEPSFVETDGERALVTPPKPKDMNATAPEQACTGVVQLHPKRSQSGTSESHPTTAQARDKSRGEGEELPGYHGSVSAIEASDIPAHVLLIDEAVLALRVWGWLKLPARYATADSVEVTTLSALTERLVQLGVCIWHAGGNSGPAECLVQGQFAVRRSLSSHYDASAHDSLSAAHADPGDNH